MHVWQARQVEQVLLGGACKSGDQVYYTSSIFQKERPGCLRGLLLPGEDSETWTTAGMLLIGKDSMGPFLSYRAPWLKSFSFLWTISLQWGQRLPYLTCGDARPSSPSGRPRQRIRWCSNRQPWLRFLRLKWMARWCSLWIYIEPFRTLWATRHVNIPF